MATPLTLSTDSDVDGAPRVIAAGEIDLSNIDVFKRALADACANSRALIKIDLSAVRYVDSAGIHALFDHADVVDRLDVVVHPLLVRVLTVSGFTKVANVQPA